MTDKFDILNSPGKEWIKGFNGRVIHGSNVTIVFWEVEAGAILPSHSHPHEQITTVLKGSFTLTLNGREITLSDGEGIIIPPHTPHGGVTTSVSKIIDVFYPVREDYK